MELNTLAGFVGVRKRKKRVGRGIGSGLGKTAGRGHKGQKSRSGGSVKPGFEGGQQPLQRRLPKYGFSSRKSLVTDEIRLSEIQKIDADVVNLGALRSARLIHGGIKRVKIICSGSISRAVTIQGLRLTKQAKQAIEAAGGKVEE